MSFEPTPAGFMNGQEIRRKLVSSYYAFFSLGLMMSLAIMVSVSTAEPEQSKAGWLLDLKGPIGPAVSDYVSKGLELAREDKASLVILRLDTPGGLDTSMRDIIKAILASAVPVVTYVAPSGARAASAGTYIMYASHFAAMAPGTNLGAATPVRIGGGSSPLPLPGAPKKEDKGADKGQPAVKPTVGMNEKILNDAVAFIRSLAQMRGRNTEWAEKAVREAASLPSEEALKVGVIDVIAKDVNDLLAKLSGRSTKILGAEVRLDTKGMLLQSFEPDWRTKLLGIITNPNIAYVLMLIGIYGLLLEFYNPGVMVPGTIGAISLLLALYAFNLLPINYAGFALILLGIALITAEAFVPSFGILGLGGVAAFAFGSVMILDTDIPGFQISRVLIGSLSLLSAGIFLLVVTLLVRSLRTPVVSGMEELHGAEGRVIDWEGLTGRVRVHGEIWGARSKKPLEPDSQVEIEHIDGLTIVVRPKR